ncbi:MAG: malectin domain-containing carbohydrate-binding protein, partial [Akkermansiaceae bacterium]|nr:malectin domain-containing carbohydrate-binding protein [Akkermansiaceae bacterium]
RNGGALQTGSVTSVNGGGSRNLGSAPNNATSDWVILVETQQRSIAYIHGDVSEDGSIPSGSDPAYDQMLLTDSGPTGLSEFKAMVEAEGYTITQHYDAETTLNAEFLNQFDVIVFGLHQKLWSAAEKTALDAWLREGGGALFYSDSAAGGKWSIVGAQNPVGQSAVNNVISAYGMEVLVDQADGVKAYRSGPDATHPVVFDRPILEGEGVSPLAVDPASDVEILIPYVDDPDYKVSGNATTQHTQNITISNPQYAALATVGIGNGRLMAMFDRQPMWNDGPGSDIDMRDNRTILMRVVDYLAGNLVATGQHPYQNTPAAIPGTIVSGHYDEGGQGVAYYDTTTGFEGSDDWRSDDVDGGENVIAWFSNGEWLEYTVDVAEAGTYTLVVNGASNAGGGTLHIEFGGVDKTGPIAIPDTGNWASFVEITIPDISLAAGEQVMRVVKDSGSLNLGDMTFSGSASNTAPTANAGPSQTVTDSDGDGFADVSLDGSGSTDADGTIAEYVWSEGTTQIATGVNPVVTLAVGTHTITLTVTDDSGASDTDTLDITVEAAPAGQAPYGGSVAAIPGTIVSGHYDEGGEGVAYHDTTAGFEGSVDWRNDDVDGSENVIGWFADGEWLEYTVNVAEAGTYDVVVKAACGYGNGGTLHIEFDGVDKTGAINVPYTSSWGSYVEMTVSGVSLEAGEQVMRVVKDSGYLNLSDMTFSQSSSNAAPTANAGPSQTVTDSDDDGFADVTLDGSGSTDSDGTIAEYVWSEGGVEIARTSSATITASLAVGTHALSLTVIDNDGAASTNAAEVTITVEAASGAQVVAAINCGGPAYAAEDGTAYSADSGFSGGKTYTTGHAISGTTDDSLYQSERYGNVTYSIPVDNGDYTVTLKMAEIYQSAAGQRVFDVLIEGALVVDDLDIYAQVGHDAAHDLTFTTTVSDGSLSIDMVSVINNAKMSAILVTQAVSGNTAPTADAGLDQTVTDVDGSGSESVTLDGGGSIDPDGTIAEYVWSESGVEIARTSSATVSVDLAVGTHALSLTVIDNEGAVSANAAEVTITVESPTETQIVAAINCGGPAYTAEDGTAYSADNGFSGGKTYTTGHAISGTTDDSLYQSERYGNVTYSIPVANGDYTVTLKMAEIYQTAAGLRLFDVLIEGAQVVDDLDIYAQVGHDAAHDLTFTTTVSDGSLSIDLVSVINNAKMSAILVTQQANSGSTEALVSADTAAFIQASSDDELASQPADAEFQVASGAFVVTKDGGSEGRHAELSEDVQGQLLLAAAYQREFTMAVTTTTAVWIFECTPGAIFEYEIGENSDVAVTYTMAEELTALLDTLFVEGEILDVSID